MVCCIWSGHSLHPGPPNCKQRICIHIYYHILIHPLWNQFLPSVAVGWSVTTIQHEYCCWSVVVVWLTDWLSHTQHQLRIQIPFHLIGNQWPERCCELWVDPAKERKTATYLQLSIPFNVRMISTTSINHYYQSVFCSEWRRSKPRTINHSMKLGQTKATMIIRNWCT